MACHRKFSGLSGERKDPPVHRCCVCGGDAPFGLGPPMRPLLVWFCSAHYQRTPEYQSWVTMRLLELGEKPLPAHASWVTVGSSG